MKRLYKSSLGLLLVLCLFACFLSSCTGNFGFLGKKIKAAEARGVENEILGVFSSPSFISKMTVPFYFLQTKDAIAKSRESKQKMPQCADINNSFLWGFYTDSLDDNITKEEANSGIKNAKDEVNVFIAECQRMRQPLMEVRDSSGEVLQRLNGIFVPKECKELHQSYIDFFSELNKHSQRGVEYTEYYENFSNAEIDVLNIVYDFVNASYYSPGDIVRKLQNFQGKVVTIKDKMNSFSVPNDCAKLHNSLLVVLDLMYGLFDKINGEANKAIHATSRREINKIVDKIEEVVDQDCDKIEDAENEIYVANICFNDSALALDAKLSEIGANTNSEINSVITEYLNGDYDTPGEFFSTALPENQI